MIAKSPIKSSYLEISDHVKSNTRLNVDTPGIIKNVKVLGPESNNGRTYTEQAQDDCVRLYEGVTVKIDHPKQEDALKNRPLLETFGKLENVRRETDGVYADLHYLESHPSAPLIVERAAKMPETFGLSHNASGDHHFEGTQQIVTSIDKVRSVDIVENPATTNGLFESDQSGNRPMKKTRTVAHIAQTLPEKQFGKAILLEMIGDEHPDGTDLANTEVEVEPEASSDEQAKAAFRAMVVAAFDDGSLDTQATVTRIKEILKAQDKLMGAGDTKTEMEVDGDGNNSSDGDDDMSESLQNENKELKKQLKEANDKEACRVLLEEAEVDVTQKRIDWLAKLSTKEERQELIAEFKGEPLLESTEGGKKPASSPPKKQGGEEDVELYKGGGKGLASSLR